MSMDFPPAGRSRRAHLLIPPAGRGEFTLQQCAQCQRFLWPMHEGCPGCLSANLPLTKAPRGGRVLSTTTAEVPVAAYFRKRAPWRVGLVDFDCGPQALVHLHAGVGPGDRVRLSLVLDRSGHAVLFAGPEEKQDMSDDPQWQAMAGDPAGQRVLITDARHPATLPLAAALRAAGAAEVVLASPAPLGDLPEGVTARICDLGSDTSVATLAAELGAEVDIVIHTADLAEAGAPPAQVMEVVTFGLMRLIAHLAPRMAARGRAGAWVNLAAIAGLVPLPVPLGYTAAHAAALALTPQLRRTLASGGVRLMTALHDPAPLSPRQATVIAEAIVAGLRQGREEIAIGGAGELLQRHRDNPRALSAELLG